MNILILTMNTQSLNGMKKKHRIILPNTVRIISARRATELEKARYEYGEIYDE